MSLNIYIISPEPIKKKSTGIYARIDGQTRELTREEAIEHFPDVFHDASEVSIQEYETNEFWHGNITHNLAEMADECFPDLESLYTLLWRDKEPTNIVIYVYQLFACLFELQNNPETYKQFNPPNGWGTYEQLVEFVRSFIHALVDMPPGSTIEFSM